MKFTEQKIEGVWIIKTKIFIDVKGYFMETYKKELFILSLEDSPKQNW